MYCPTAPAPTTKTRIFRSSVAGRSETAAGACGAVELLAQFELCPLDPRDDELRDAIATPHGERFVAVVDQQHADRAAVVRIDRAGRIQTGDAVSHRKPTARADLCFVATRQCDAEARGDQRTAAW